MFGLTPRKKSSANSIWGMTPKGKHKLESALNEESATIKILEFISDNGSSNTSEIANGLQVNPRRLERKLQQMERAGDIMQVSGDD